jgi:urease accessory protein
MPKVTGEITAEFAVRNGQTQLIRKFHTSPLKIAKTFRYTNRTLSRDTVDSDQLGVYVMDCSPGLMSGDHYEQQWHLHQNTSVFLTNQSFTKIHPSMDSGGSTQRQIFRLEEGSLLEYMPEPMMPFKDSSYSGEMEVHLKPGSAAIFSDVLCPGRTQRGEKFHYTSYANRVKVYYGTELVYYQHQRIEPERMNLQSLGSWEDETHLGSLYVFSEQIRQRHVNSLLGALAELSAVEIEGAPSPKPLRYGASLTHKHGMIFTVMGGHAWQLQRILTEAWGIIRSQLLSLSPLTVLK